MENPTLACNSEFSPNNIKFFAELQPDGVEGVIIGKALYGGQLTVAEALRIAGSGADARAD